MGADKEELMFKLKKRLVNSFSLILVPIIFLISPQWFSIAGVGPSWAVLWLLPWALVNGSLSGVFAGISLGLILDAISLGGGTQIPVLALLGFWWGRIGRFSLPIDRSLSLGLLAWVGSTVLSISLWLQFLLIEISIDRDLFNAWSMHTILAQSIITTLIAPILCSWLLFIFRRCKFSSR